MATYVISDVDVHDPHGFQEYLDRVPGVIAAHGVEYVVRGGPVRILEGDWQPARMVVLRFEDYAHVMRWYESREYQAVMSLRRDSATVRAVVVEGVR